MKSVSAMRRVASILAIVATLIGSIIVGAPPAQAVTVPVPAWENPAVTSTDAKLTAHWNPVAGATKYYVYWAMPDGRNTVQATTTTEMDLSRYSFPATGEFCARVRAFIGSDYGSTSEARCLTVGNPEPPPPAVPVPTFADPAITVTNSSLTLRWNPVADATKYYVWWKIPNQSAHSLSSTTNTSHVLSRHNRPTDGEYCAYVRAFVGSDSSDHSPEQCVTVSAPPEPPATPTFPYRPITVTDDHLTVRWNAVPGATRYMVYWAIPTRSGNTASSVTATTHSLSRSLFDETGEFCVRVRAIGDGGSGVTSGSQCTTVSAPPPPTTTTTRPTTTTTRPPTTTTTRPPTTTTTTRPAAPATPTWRNPALNVSADNVTALWNGASGVSEWELEWKQGSTIVSTKMTRSRLAGFRYTGLTGRLCARVRAFNGTTPSAWSSPKCFVAIAKPPPPAWGDPPMTARTNWLHVYWKPVAGADTYSITWTLPNGSTTLTKGTSSSTHDALRVSEVGEYCASIRTNVRPQSSIDSPTRCVQYLGPTTDITGSARTAVGNQALADIGVCSRHIASNVEQCTKTTAAGSFLLNGLTAGDHVLRFVDSANQMQPYCWGSTGSCDSPGTVTLVAGQRSHFNAKLIRAEASVSGEVSRASDGGALRGIRVCAIDIDGVRTCAATGSNGRFTISQVPTGSYTLEYRDPNGSYQTQCYRQRLCSNPTRFSLTSFGASDLDASLVAAPTRPVDNTPPPDRTPPTWLVNRADIYVIHNHDLPGGITVEFTWQGAIDSHDNIYEEPAKFDLYLNGVYNQTVDWNTWKLSTDKVKGPGNPRFVGLTPNAGYEFGVVAIDAAGNRSAMYTETKYPLPLARDNGATGSQSGDPEPSKNPAPVPDNPGSTPTPVEPPQPPADEVEVVPPTRITTSGSAWNCRSAGFRTKSADFRQVILEWANPPSGAVLSYTGIVQEAIFQGGDWRPGDRVPISVSGPRDTRELEFNGLDPSERYFLKVQANGTGGELGSCIVEVETRDPVPVSDHPCTDAFGGVAPGGCGAPPPAPRPCIEIGVELPGNDNLSGCLASVAVCVELGVTFGIDFGTSICSILLLDSLEVYQTTGGTIGVGVGLPAHVSYHGARSNAEVASLWSGISACVTVTFQAGCTGFNQNPDGEPVFFIFDGVMPTTALGASAGWSNLSQPTGFDLLFARDALCKRYPQHTPGDWCRGAEYGISAFDLICQPGEPVVAELTISRPVFGGPDSATYNVYHALALPEDAYRSDIVWTPPSVTLGRGEARRIQVPAASIGHLTIRQWDEQFNHAWSTELIPVPTQRCI